MMAEDEENDVIRESNLSLRIFTVLNVMTPSINFNSANVVHI